MSFLTKMKFVLIHRLPKMSLKDKIREETLGVLKNNLKHKRLESAILRKKILSTLLSLSKNVGEKIGLYAALSHELDLLETAKILRSHGLSTLYPRCVHEKLHFHKVGCEKSDLQKNKTYGFLEPNCSLEQQTPNILVVPGIAFDKSGNRIGHGKGFYDRYIAMNPKIITVSAGFSMQFYNALPSEKHDQQIQHVIFP